MITAYNSYHTTHFFNSALSKQNNKLYCKNRRPPVALHGRVVECVQHLSVSVSISFGSLIPAQILRSQPHNCLCVCFSVVTFLKKNDCFAKGYHFQSLAWSPAAMASCCSGCTSTGKVCPRRTCDVAMLSVSGTTYWEVKVYHTTCIMPYHIDIRIYIYISRFKHCIFIVIKP